MTGVSEMTTVGLARLPGLSTRRGAEVRGEGRLPLTPCGTRIDGRELVAREERGERRDSWGFRPAQVFAFARFLSATGENLANPRSC
jgi:hypothetical protein